MQVRNNIFHKLGYFIGYANDDIKNSRDIVRADSKCIGGRQQWLVSYKFCLK